VLFKFYRNEWVDIPAAAVADKGTANIQLGEFKFSFPALEVRPND